MQQRAEDFAAAMMTETGSTKGWALFNVGLAAGMLREAGAMTTQITGDVIPTDKPNNLALAVRQPVGVILGIAPWNARSSSACAPSPCRSPAATPSSSRPPSSARRPTSSSAR